MIINLSKRKKYWKLIRDLKRKYNAKNSEKKINKSESIR